MKWLHAIALTIMTAAAASAQTESEKLDWRERYPELKRILRTETRPAELIGAILEHSRYPRHMDVKPPAEGFASEVAFERIRENPARYAPEIRRRLLELLPQRIESAEHLAALGGATPVPEDVTPLDGTRQQQMLSLMGLTELLGRAHAEPILREVFDRSSTLIRQAQPIYDRAETRWSRKERPPPVGVQMYYGMDFLWSVQGHLVRAADALGSPIFIDDCLNLAENVRDRPEDWLLMGFGQVGAEYLLQFVEQRPEIYTRLAPLADEDEMIKLGDAAYNLAYNIKTDVGRMRERLEKAGKLAREP